MFGGSYPGGIAIDVESDHLYWADYMHGMIFRSDLDGSNRTEISTAVMYPYAIALDTVSK